MKDQKLKLDLISEYRLDVKHLSNISLKIFIEGHKRTTLLQSQRHRCSEWKLDKRLKRFQ